MTKSPRWFRYKGDGSTTTDQPSGGPKEEGRYLADEKLVVAVNTALAVEQPLLVTGEPGTGKTTLARSIAAELGLGDVLEFHTRSDHQARDALYEIDYLQRFYHAQVGDSRTADIESYIRWQALGEAIRSPAERVVLIDEIDKAPRDFPNDLLNELDRMEFRVPELGRTFVATKRPILLITSNSERQLPDPFLRRCVFHRIAFPSNEVLEAILRERLAHLNLAERLIEAAVKRFTEIRALAGLEKKPATAELLTWLRVLHLAGVDVRSLEAGPIGSLPFLNTLAKTESDAALLDHA